MSRNEDLTRVLGWIDELNSSLEAARSDQKAMNNLLTSAEYELQQVRRQLTSVETGPAASRALPLPVSNQGANGDAGAAFARKLRHPDGLRHGWWTVLRDDS